MSRRDFKGHTERTEITEIFYAGGFYYHIEITVFEPLDKGRL